MNDEREHNEFSSLIKTAAIIAIVFAVMITGYLLIFSKEQYSSLYIIPESYQNQTSDDKISFTYGVISFEEGITNYDIQMFLNDKLVKTEQFQLNHNEHSVKNETLLLTGSITYPAKIQLMLNNGISTEEVHFWVEKNNHPVS